MVSEQICRICLMKCDKSCMFSIFEPDIMTIFQKVLPVAVNKDEGLPSLLCEKCFLLIKEFYALRTLAIHSDKTLRMLLTTKTQCGNSKDYKLVSHEYVDNNGNLNYNNREATQAGESLADQNDVSNYASPISYMDSDMREKTVFSERTKRVKPLGSSKHFKCQHCDKIVETKSSMIRHLKLHTGEKEHKCPICKKAFFASYNFTAHMRVHNRETSHKCDVCGKEFFYRNKLILHMRTHTGEKPFACEVCKKVFTANSRLRVHQKLHENNKDPLKCKMCNKLFAYNNSLKVHERTHTQTRPFHCSYCTLKFKQKVHLDNHVSAKHTKDRSFLCYICGEHFPIKSRLNAHLEQQHLEADTQCDACGNLFTNRQALKQHLKLHSQESSSICDVCGKVMKTRPNLMAHRKTHFIVKNCQYCG